MPSAEGHPERESISPDTDGELRAKKGIGILDAVLLSAGFTTSNLQHIITPVSEGGLGAGLASLGAAVASIVVLSISTIVIAAIISYSVLKIINKSAQEAELLLEKENEWKERQVMFFSRLLYLRHLLKASGQHHLPHFKRILQTHLDLDNHAAADLALSVDSLYREEKGFARVFLQRDKRVMSEEKAIQQYFSLHSAKYMPRIQEGLRYLDIVHPAHKKNWKPELIGIFAGFISFISMGSGFLGAYSSVVTLALTISGVSLAVPVLGWAIFGASLIFALAIGLTVRRYTDKSIKCENMVDDIEDQKSKLADGLSKIHELEMQLLTERVHRADDPAPEFKRAEGGHSLVRARSWSGGFFARSAMPLVQREAKPAPDAVAGLTAS